MECKTCKHYYFYEMITSDSYSYSGRIPCLTCSRFQTVDNYEPMSQGSFYIVDKPNFVSCFCRGAEE